MVVETVLAGVGAVFIAVIGSVLVIREYRRRERQVIDDLTAELDSLRRDLLNCQRWAFKASQLMLEKGLSPPELPEVRPHIPNVAKRQPGDKR